jgi:hypothetical protein
MKKYLFVFLFFISAIAFGSDLYPATAPLYLEGLNDWAQQKIASGTSEPPVASAAEGDIFINKGIPAQTKIQIMVASAWRDIGVTATQTIADYVASETLNRIISDDILMNTIATETLDRIAADASLSADITAAMASVVVPLNASFTLSGLGEKNFESLASLPTTLSGYGITDGGEPATYTGNKSIIGRLDIATGTLANLAFRFNGDVDSGWYSPSANSIALVLAGAEWLRFSTPANVGIGVLSQSFVSGTENTSLGWLSGYSLGNGSYNTGLGAVTFGNVGNGSLNTVVGARAFNVGGTGNGNTVLGAYAAGGTGVIGGSNVLVGAYSGSSAHTAQAVGVANSIAIGYLSYNTASNQIRLGTDQTDFLVASGTLARFTLASASIPVPVVLATGSLASLSFSFRNPVTGVTDSDTGIYSPSPNVFNIIVGGNKFLSHGTRAENTIIGENACQENGCYYNTIIGYSADASGGNSSHLLNTSIGYFAGNTNQGNHSSATNVGAEAGNYTLSYGAYVGAAAGKWAIAANYGVGIGAAAGQYASGHYNTSVGYNSVGAGTGITGQHNVMLGDSTGLSANGQIAGVWNSLALGYNAYTTASNQAVIGNSSLTDFQVGRGGTLLRSTATATYIPGVLIASGIQIPSHVYAGRYVDDNASATDVITQNVYEKIGTDSAGNITTITGMKTNAAGHITSNATNSFTIGANGSGTYRVLFCVSFSGGSSDNYEIHAFKNDTILPNVGIERKMGTGGDIGAATANGFVACNPGDVIDMRVVNTTGTSDITIRMMSFTMERITVD